ncbi:hypothetical protein S122051_2008 [Staphylococcus aureus subsp. aureus 122051]|nr:hypothetical protein S122051_2008 [Staphylococcus aureus subsp. aureus 122051]QGQ73484.1 hypothetical protein SAST44_00195 [Staphylococcus aureus]QGQ76889.1 hypothetical protein SAST45_00196 [Staphylococcus aureus]
MSKFKFVKTIDVYKKLKRIVRKSKKHCMTFD